VRGQRSSIWTSAYVIGFLASVARAAGDDVAANGDDAESDVEQAASPVLQPTTADGDSLAEIVVTATKTGSQQLQKTPVAVSVVGGEFMAIQGLSNIKDLAPYVPSLTFSQNTAAAIIYIRGIGSNNVAAGSDPDVTMQVDGVYIARPIGEFSDFLDVDRVEVLRGPQGTLYGRNAVGGTINVISRQPTDTPTGEVRVTGGNFSLLQGDAYVSGPIRDNLQASIAVTFKTHSPYFDNIVPGKPGVGEANRGGGHLQLRAELTDQLTATTRADFSRVGGERFESYSQVVAPTPFPSLANSIVGSFRQVALNGDQYLNQENGGVSEDLTFQLSPELLLKSITAWRRSSFSLTNDNDATEFTLQQSHQAESDSAVSQEFNLQYRSGPLRSVAGVYYFSDADIQRQTVDVPPSVITPAPRALFVAVSPDIKSRSYAFFAQASYTMVERLTATLGARYTSERKTLDQDVLRSSENPATFGAVLPGFPIGFHSSRDDSAFTPKIGLDYQLTEDALLYASATKGFKSGGFNFSATTPATAGFAPEKIWSYEGGLKTEWLEHRLRVNATGFYYDYTDLQVQQLISAGTLTIGNAATAHVKGLELEAVGKVTRDLQLTLNGSFLDARYGTYNNASVPSGLVRFVPGETCVATVCTVDASGRRLNQAPRFSALAAIDETHGFGTLSATAHVDYSWRDHTFFDPSNVLVASQGSYGLLNASLGLGSSGITGWRAEIFGRNLTDKGYYQTIAASSVTVNGLVGDPRTYGLQLNWHW
jgi:iron complex outermembrane recepter protein